MADEKKPTINVTRGNRKPPRSEAQEKQQRDDADERTSSLGNLPAGIAQSARDVWLAGLGALSVVEDQGTKLFRALVQEGEHWEEERLKSAESTLKQAGSEGERAADAAAKALDEQVVRRVRKGVDTALARAGVPTRSAIDDLRRQVDDLSRKADRLAAQLEEAEDTTTQ